MIWGRGQIAWGIGHGAKGNKLKAESSKLNGLIYRARSVEEGAEGIGRRAESR